MRTTSYTNRTTKLVALVATVLALALLGNQSASAQEGVIGKVVNVVPAAAFSGATSTLGAVVEEFLEGDGTFSRVDVDSLEGAMAAALPDSDSVFRPSGQLDPVSKALFAADLMDGELDRARYHVVVRHVQVAAGADTRPVDTVLASVARYDLGAAIHAETVRAYGAENVAGVEEFISGPTSVWRFAMVQVQGVTAELLGASRSELTGADADEAWCLVQACTSLEAPTADIPWRPLEAPDLAGLAPNLGHDWSDFGLPPAASLSGALVAAAFLDPYQPEREQNGAVVAELLIERNLAPEMSTSAVLYRGGLLDDSVTAMWHRAWDLGDGATRGIEEAFECGRGSAQFAEPGAYCP